MADVASVFALIQAGTQFDSTLAPRLSNAATEVATVRSMLDAQPTLKAMLNNYDPSSNMPQLATYIADGLPTLVERMAVFSSVSSLDDTASISTAFGAEFCGRTFVAAIDAITTVIFAGGTDVDTLTDRVTQLVALPATVPALIAAQDAFYADSAATLNNYADALHLIQMFSTSPLNAVVGAAGSDALLALLNPQPVIGSTPPPVDGSNSGVGDPIPPL